MAREISYNNFEILLVVFMPNITTNHAFTYTILMITYQKHYPELGSDTSSVWNFCACFSDVILWGNQWWHHEMSAIFSGYSICNTIH